MLDYLASLARHGRIDPVEYYVSDRYKVVYVENAKVACTTIKQVLFPDVRYELVGQAEFHRLIRRKAHFSLPSHARDYLVFSVFRNPAARLVSCYRDKVQRDAAEQENSILQRRFHRVLFRLFGSVDIADRTLGFDEFSRAAARIPDRLSDRHFASQAKVYHAVVGAPRHFVATIERLPEQWRELQALTGLPDLDRTNTSRPDGESQVVISPAAEDAIVRRYADDFTLLGYPGPSARDKMPLDRELQQ